MASGALVHLAGQLDFVRRKTRLWGDKILAGKDRWIEFPITELPSTGYYFHSGHGEETSETHVGDPLRSMVPMGSAYMTNVRCGEVTMSGTDDYETILFFSGLELTSPEIPPEKRIPPSEYLGLLMGCLRGEKDAIAVAKPLFRPEVPGELEILVGGQPFIPSHFMPYWTYEKPFAPGNFMAMRSGLLPYGKTNLAKEKHFKRYDIGILHFMYEYSVFPTFDMVVKSGVKGFLEGKEPNRDQVEGHLSAVFRCSSEALMLRFPGFHAHTVCRTPIRSDIAINESNDERPAKKIASQLIAAHYFKERTPFFPLIQTYANSCPWGGAFPEKPATEPGDPTRLTHPDTWTEEQREHAMEWAQQEYFRKLGGAGGGGAAAAGGAGGGGAKRQRTQRNRRSRRQPRRHKTRRKSRQSIGPRSELK
jgi:hypothetical protein